MNKISIMNQAREKYRIERQNIIIRNARNTFKKHKNDVDFIAGIVLYWAEGKRSKIESSNLELCNSDPALLKIYCNFVRKYFNLNGHSIKARLFLYPDLDEGVVKSFWSSKLCIPTDNFIKSYVLNSNAKITKKKLKYGTCSVYVTGKKFRLTIDAWIDCLIKLRE